ncbi:hypothetical protein [Bacterioplanoides pacificum]|uniref:Uncharacterized protein n=1 Tax=Bacterioplanoides pacificum TaxID=1171596 RepID=A0ABV7VRX2_9GAMM
MQDIDTTSTQSLIDRYYEEEKAQRELEQTLATVTTRLDASDLAMLNVIARRFRKTREEVAQEVLSSALVDLFARVEAGERKLMARDADEGAKSLANEIAEENGVHSIEFKGGAWGNHDKAITKLERKKAKQDDEAEAALEAEVKKRVAAALQSQQPEKNTEPASPLEADNTNDHADNTDNTDSAADDEAAAITPEDMSAASDNDENQPASVFAS